MLIYEDAVCKADMPEESAMIGQIVITPKDPAGTLADVPPEVAVQLFYVASYAATAVFEGMGAHGTNILVHEGDSLQVIVLPRMQGDGIDLYWHPEREDPAKLSATASRIRDKLFYVGKKSETPQQIAQDVQTPEKSAPKKPPLDPANNYMLRQLRRKP